MGCFHPLTAYQGPIVNENGRKPLIFLKGDVDMSMSVPEGHRLLKVPCGLCDGCRLDYGKEWAVRCSLEAREYEHNYFVTLTYNDAFVPMSAHDCFDPETGEVLSEDWTMTLNYRDLQKFWKRLRVKFAREKGFTGLRYYACGEYGPKNMRPHFHAILFNCPLDDLEVFGRRDGYTYYRSKFIEDCWRQKRRELRKRKDGTYGLVTCRDENKKIIYDSMGFITVCEFTYETASYVARYMLKKHKGFDRDFYEKNGLAPESSRMSRNPGIASKYFEEHKEEIYDFDQICVATGLGEVLKARPPKYFDRLFDIDNPEELSKIKEKRQKCAERSMQEQLKKTDLSEKEYLAVKEAKLQERIKKLQRSL